MEADSTARLRSGPEFINELTRNALSPGSYVNAKVRNPNLEALVGVVEHIAKDRVAFYSSKYLPFLRPLDPPCISLISCALLKALTHGSDG